MHRDSPCFGRSFLLGVFKISALGFLSIVFQCGKCKTALKGCGSQLPLSDHLGGSGPLNLVISCALLNAGSVGRWCFKWQTRAHRHVGGTDPDTSAIAFCPGTVGLGNNGWTFAFCSCTLGHRSTLSRGEARRWCLRWQRKGGLPCWWHRSEGLLV